MIDAIKPLVNPVSWGDTWVGVGWRAMIRQMSIFFDPIWPENAVQAWPRRSEMWEDGILLQLPFLPYSWKWKMGPSNISFLSFRLIFHFHGWSRMGVHWKRCPAFWMLSSSKVRCFQLLQRQYVWSWKKCCRNNWCNWKKRWSLPTLLLWRCA